TSLVQYIKSSLTACHNIEMIHSAVLIGPYSHTHTHNHTTQHTTQTAHTHSHTTTHTHTTPPNTHTHTHTHTHTESTTTEEHGIIPLSKTSMNCEFEFLVLYIPFVTGTALSDILSLATC